VTGRWFRSGDVNALASAIRELMNDAVVAQMSARAYDAYWTAPASLSRHVGETLAVYEGMLARCGRPSSDPR
jgi:hypothetical protein